ncbi:MAG: ABC transporter permease [Hyphomicrobiales bacterium]|nr:ABC transporter permease [Hyphomicrobiales bacterium]
MIRLVVERIGTSLVALLGATFFTFLALRVMPGDPARLFLGPFATPEALTALNQELGLDKPLPQQFLTFVSDFLTGDWGRSYSTGEQVTTLLADRFPATLELGLYAFLLTLIGAVSLAVLAAYRRGPVSEGGPRLLSMFALGVPQFWLGLLLLMLFFEYLGIAPGPNGRLSLGATPPPTITGFFTIDALIAGDFATFADAFAHLVLPAIALGLFPLGFLLRLLRANLLDVVDEPFVMVARSRGVPRFLAFVRHVLPNAFIPTLTAAGLILGQLLAGSVLVERVFNWPGAGALVANGVLRQDFSVVQTFVLLSAVIYLVASLIVDLLAAWIDPRLRPSSDAQ